MCVCVNPRTIIWVAIHILIKNSSTMLVKVRWIWGGDFAEVQAVPSYIKCHWVGWVNWLAIFHSQTLTFHRFPFQLRLSFITLPFPYCCCCYYHSTPLSHLLTHVCMPCLLARSLSLWEYKIFWMMRIFSNLLFFFFCLPFFFISRRHLLNKTPPMCDEFWFLCCRWCCSLARSPLRQQKL